MATKTKAKPAESVDAATLELRAAACRAYYAANSAANEAATAAWRSPTPDSAWTMLQAQIAANAAYLDYCRARGMPC